MPITDSELDTAAKVAQFIGDSAKLAMTVGSTALPIIEFVAPWVPGIGPIVTDLAIALPIIAKIAQYAPQVRSGIENNKPLIEAVVGVGDALLSPLSDLTKAFPQLPAVHELFSGIQEFLQRNEFKPQDPLFDRMGIGSQS